MLRPAMNEVTRAWEFATKRAPQMKYGRVESPWKVELDGDHRYKRRVYEDWNQFRQGRLVPLVVIVKGETIPVERRAIRRGLKEAARRWKQWTDSLELALEE